MRGNQGAVRRRRGSAVSALSKIVSSGFLAASSIAGTHLGKENTGRAQVLSLLDFSQKFIDFNPQNNPGVGSGLVLNAQP